MRGWMQLKVEDESIEGSLTRVSATHASQGQLWRHMVETAVLEKLSTATTAASVILSAFNSRGLATWSKQWGKHIAWTKSWFFTKQTVTDFTPQVRDVHCRNVTERTPKQKQLSFACPPWNVSHEDVPVRPPTSTHLCCTKYSLPTPSTSDCISKFFGNTYWLWSLKGMTSPKIPMLCNRGPVEIQKIVGC